MRISSVTCLRRGGTTNDPETNPADILMGLPKKSDKKERSIKITQASQTFPFPAPRFSCVFPPSKTALVTQFVCLHFYDFLLCAFCFLYFFFFLFSFAFSGFVYFGQRFVVLFSRILNKNCCSFLVFCHGSLYMVCTCLIEVPYRRLWLSAMLSHSLFVSLSLFYMSFFSWPHSWTLFIQFLPCRASQRLFLSHTSLSFRSIFYYIVACLYSICLFCCSVFFCLANCI